MRFMGYLKLIHFIQVDAFWCFVGFMDRVASNFDFDQGNIMKIQV